MPWVSPQVIASSTLASPPSTKGAAAVCVDSFCRVSRRLRGRSCVVLPCICIVVGLFRAGRRVRRMCSTVYSCFANQ